ncbi:hypothetical protein IPC775_16115 [Pseudomonas aeruginosa]|nr:hypothetical protein IPC775_16115 [Pseudomonas aeruginosa]
MNAVDVKQFEGLGQSRGWLEFWRLLLSSLWDIGNRILEARYLDHFRCRLLADLVIMKLGVHRTVLWYRKN